MQCESGGQNLPPNSAGASGYYQMLPSTWHGLGGSTPHAYQASKAEQDRLAAKLWAGGAGARNWVCAGLVGWTSTNRALGGAGGGRRRVCARRCITFVATPVNPSPSMPELTLPALQLAAG